MGADSYIKIDDIGPWTLDWEQPHNAGMHQGRMHLRTGEGPFTEGDGSKRGLHIVFDSNPGSADFNPRYFNRARRVLAAAGKLAPAADISEVSRRLRDR